MVNGLAILLLIFKQTQIFYKIKIKLNLSTQFGFAINTLALVLRYSIDVAGFISDDYVLYPWKRGIYCLVQIVFFSFYLNNFSKVLISWRLQKMFSDHDSFCGDLYKNLGEDEIFMQLQNYST